jgi:PAS domain S-box-containing protein
MRILLVDDDKSTLKALAGVLASKGHSIDECHSAAPALERMRKDRYDVLLTDLVMSSMDGVELVTTARELCPTLRCMVMSGHKRNGDVPSDVAWFKKPVDVDQVLAALDGSPRPDGHGDGHFRELFENAPDGIFIAGADGRYTDVNPAGCRILGYAPEELIGRSITEFVAPGELERQAALAKHIADGGHQVSEWMLRRKDGSFVPVELSSNALPDGRMRAFVRDISERYAAEEARRLSELKFSGIVSISADAIVAVDETGRINLFNEGARTMFGYSEEEILGSPLDVLMPERFRQGHREQVKTFAAGTGGTRRMGTRNVTIHGLRKNGEEFPGDATISKMVVGGQRLLIVAMRDITEQKRMEEEQRLLAEVGAIFVESWNDADRLLTEVAGACVRELADWCAVDVVRDGEVRRLRIVHRDPAKAPLCDELLRRRLGKPTSKALEEVLTTQRPTLLSEIPPGFLESVADGPEHLALLQSLGTRSAMIVPLVTRGQTIGSLNLGTTTASRRYDTRDLAHAERLAARISLALENARLHGELERAVRARDDVLGIVAHDLRNPLNTIVLHAQTLQRRNQPERRDQTASLGIRRAAKRMNTLIQDLLEVARLEGGQRLTITRDTLQTDGVLAEAVERQEQTLSEYKRTLNLDLSAAPPTIHGDRGRLLQIFDNLLGNAIKFSRERITIGASVSNGQALFWVTDDGRGVRSEDIPRLFDRFWQASRQDGRGAGLGLWIVKQIVDAHGGRLWVESELDQGTTFYFTLAATPPPEA